MSGELRPRSHPENFTLSIVQGGDESWEVMEIKGTVNLIFRFKDIP